MKILFTFYLISAFHLISSAQLADTIDFGDYTMKSTGDFTFRTTSERSYTICVNELLASNDTQERDEFGEYDDWFEIYNYGDEPVLLNGIFISDNIDNPLKWQFNPSDSILLQAHQFFLFWADGEPEEGDHHTSFKLSSDGEELTLYTPEMVRVDEIIFPQQKSDVSYGRYPDGGVVLANLSTATPGMSNEITSIVEYLPSIESSIVGGICKEQKVLRLNISTPSARIRYTTDCSIPTERSPIFPDSIVIDSTTIVRAKAFADEWIESPTLTRSFIFTDDEYDNRIISLVTEQDELTGSSGLFTKTLSDIEIPADFEYIENDTTLFIAKTGIKLHSPKAITQYSLRLYARGSYGNTCFEHSFFGKEGPNKFKRLILRNGGNDNAQKAHSNTHMRDHVVHELAMQSNRNAMISRTKPVNVFINGEYYGVYNLRERIDEYYIETHTGVDDNFDLLERCFGYSGNRYAIEGTFDRYLQNESDIYAHDLSNDSLFLDLSECFDLENYTDYMITEIFVGNFDWMSNNIKMWSEIDQGKWQWIFWDVDHSIGLNYGKYGYSNWNTLSWALGSSGRPLGNNRLILGLLENDRFKSNFIKRFTRLLNTDFSKTNTHTILDSIKDMYSHDMQYHYRRWGSYDIDSWNDAVEGIASYFEERPVYMFYYIADEFGLQDPGQTHFVVEPANAGVIYLDENRITDDTFNGHYFSDMEYKIQAKPSDGYTFVRWEGVGDDENTDELQLYDGMTVKAIFSDGRIQDQYQVIISKDPQEGGTVYFNDIEMTDAIWERDVYADTVYHLAAVAREGYIFTGWEGIGDDENPDVLRFNSDRTITAIFEKEVIVPEEYNISIELTPYDGGSVKFNAQVDIDSLWHSIVYANSSYSISAVANDGYTFSHWEGIVGSMDIDSIEFTSDMIILAIFEEIPSEPVEYLATIEITPPGGGYVILNNQVHIDSLWNGSVCADSSYSISAIVNDGYTFSHWEGIAGSTEIDSIEFTSDMIILAIFEEIPSEPIEYSATIEITPPNGGYVLFNNQVQIDSLWHGTVYADSVYSMFAFPSEGFTFDTWAGIDTTINFENFTFDSDAFIQASFKKDSIGSVVLNHVIMNSPKLRISANILSVFDFCEAEYCNDISIYDLYGKRLGKIIIQDILSVNSSWQLPQTMPSGVYIICINTEQNCYRSRVFNGL